MVAETGKPIAEVSKAGSLSQAIAPLSPAYWFRPGSGPKPLRHGTSYLDQHRFTIIGKFGAGEGIRTLDPNLGKVARNSVSGQARPQAR